MHEAETSNGRFGHTVRGRKTCAVPLCLCTHVGILRLDDTYEHSFRAVILSYEKTRGPTTFCSIIPRKKQIAT